jgi:hypothetical protein
MGLSTVFLAVPRLLCHSIFRAGEDIKPQLALTPLRKGDGKYNDRGGWTHFFLPATGEG